MASKASRAAGTFSTSRTIILEDMEWFRHALMIANVHVRSSKTNT